MYIEEEEKQVKTTLEDRIKKQEILWNKAENLRQEKIILILKIQDVFHIEPSLSYEILDTLENDDINCLIKHFNKTNDDCDKQIIKEIIDNSVLIR